MVVGGKENWCRETWQGWKWSPWFVVVQAGSDKWLNQSPSVIKEASTVLGYGCNVFGNRGSIKFPHIRYFFTFPHLNWKSFWFIFLHTILKLLISVLKNDDQRAMFEEPWMRLHERGLHGSLLTQPLSGYHLFIGCNSWPFISQQISLFIMETGSRLITTKFYSES